MGDRASPDRDAEVVFDDVGCDGFDEQSPGGLKCRRGPLTGR